MDDSWGGPNDQPRSSRIDARVVVYKILVEEITTLDHADEAVMFIPPDSDTQVPDGYITVTLSYMVE